MVTQENFNIWNVQFFTVYFSARWIITSYEIKCSIAWLIGKKLIKLSKLNLLAQLHKSDSDLQFCFSSQPKEND